MFNSIRLSHKVIAGLKQLLQEISNPGEEICGWLAGKMIEKSRSLATNVFALHNISNSKYSFAIDVEEYVNTRGYILSLQLQPLVFYHSHPYCRVQPSYRDLEFQNIVSIPCMILSSWKDDIMFYAFERQNNTISSIQIIKDPNKKNIKP